MSCGNTQWTPLRYLLDDNTANPTAQVVTSPTLIVSNYPETLSENDLEVFPITLYKCEVALTTAWQRVRLYLWHLNKTGQAIEIGVVISVDSATATAELANVERQRTPPPNTGFAAQGICLANAQLFGTLDANGTGSCGATEDVFRTYDVADDELLGLVLEFDVKATANCNLRLRTVAYEGEEFGVWATAPPEPDTEEYPHPRGKWNHSELDVDCGTFDVSPSPTPRLRKILCCNKLGAEENRFPKDLNDQFGSRLRGLFGANLTYKCAITSEEASGMLHVYVGAIVHGATRVPPAYFGAAEIAAWVNTSNRNVPAIRWASANNNYENLVNLTEAGGLSVVQGDEETVEVRIANAGSATMPFLLVFSNTALNVNP